MKSTRRILRSLVMAIALLPVAIIAAAIGAFTWISVSNDIAADTVEAELLALPLPAATERLDSLSVAAKVAGNGNGMQYLGAMLIKSELPKSELEAYYQEQNKKTEGAAELIATTDTDALSYFHGAHGFFDDPGEAGVYILYSFGSAPSTFHEQFDLRGH